MSLMESASCESAAYRFPSGRFSTRLESSRGLRDKTNAALYRGWDTEAVCVTAKRLSIRISLGSRSGAFCCYAFLTTLGGRRSPVESHVACPCRSHPHGQDADHAASPYPGRSWRHPSLRSHSPCDSRLHKRLARPWRAAQPSRGSHGLGRLHCALPLSRPDRISGPGLLGRESRQSLW